MPDPVTDIDGYLAYLVLAGVLTDGDGSRLQQRLVHREGIVTDLNAGCGLFGPLEARDPDTFSITAIHTPEVTAEQVIAAIDEELQSSAGAAVGRGAGEGHRPLGVDHAQGTRPAHEPHAGPRLGGAAVRPRRADLRTARADRRR